MAKYLSEHQDVDSVWYFGTESGSKFVEFASAESVKRTWVNYGQVPILPKVTNVGLQIFVTYTVYILVKFY
jgi:hypothetical protein